MRASVQFSRSVLSNSLQPHGLQHARPPCPSPILGVYSNSRPLSPWCHPAILSSILLLLVSVIPSIRVFSNESVLLIRWPKYWEFQLQYQFFQWIFRTDFLQDGLVGSPRIPRDSQESFATPVQKHQFFGAQLSLWSSSHIHTWLLEKPKLRLHGHLLAK